MNKKDEATSNILQDYFIDALERFDNYNKILDEIPEYSNFEGYQSLIESIIKKSKIKLFDVKKLSKCKDQTLKELVDFEIIKYENIIKLCQKLLDEASLEKEETNKEERLEENISEKEIIFATSKMGNSVFERDLKNIPESKYADVIKCFDIIKNCDKISNTKKITRFTSNCKTLDNLCKAKEDQVRVFYKIINKDFVYVFGIDIKKDDNSKRDREVVEQRFSNVSSDFEKAKKLLLDENTREAFLARNNIMVTAINEAIKGVEINERRK